MKSSLVKKVLIGLAVCSQLLIFPLAVSAAEDGTEIEVEDGTEDEGETEDEEGAGAGIIMPLNIGVVEKS